MEFSYNEYKKMIKKLKDKNYKFCNYHNYQNNDKCVILRHDVDFSLEESLKIAYIEKEENIKSTFFILLSTDFYNISSTKNTKYIKELVKTGAEIGLHFDETKYQINIREELEKYVEQEIQILSLIINQEVSCVSMHRPSKWVLEEDMRLNCIVNSYSKEFFTEFKYLSDSRMSWKEDVFNIINENKFSKLHILTHPIWYKQEPQSPKSILKAYVDKQYFDFYDSLKSNIRDLEEFLTKDDICIEKTNKNL